MENPSHFNLNQRSEGMDNYYTDLTALQNLSGLSRQINSDLSNLSDHKYIAHQMAILYVSHVCRKMVRQIHIKSVGHVHDLLNFIDSRLLVFVNNIYNLNQNPDMI